MTPLLSSLERACRDAGRVLLESFGARADLVITEKGPSDFVSQADVRAETAIKEAILRDHPGAIFQAEETTEGRATTGTRFVVDPLDGTTNFLRGIPHWAVTIAFIEEDTLVCGVTLDPSKDEIFYAERGKGAFMRKGNATPQRIKCTEIANLDNALVHTGVPHRGRGDHEAYLRTLARVMQSVAGIRRMGAAALDFSYVASGRGDAFWEKGLKPWDMAAGVLLVREAGGIVTDMIGGDDMFVRNEVVAAAAALHPALLACARA